MSVEELESLIQSFSSLYIGILAATFWSPVTWPMSAKFQFPLHRDPRCNLTALTLLGHLLCFSSLYIGILVATRTLQEHYEFRCRFSSLYIGILAATYKRRTGGEISNVSVPFTSGSSLQRASCLNPIRPTPVSVPFTSGSSLQLKYFAFNNLIDVLNK